MFTLTVIVHNYFRTNVQVIFEIFWYVKPPTPPNKHAEDITRVDNKSYCNSNEYPKHGKCEK